MSLRNLPTITKKTVTQQRDAIMDSIQEMQRLSPGKTMRYTFHEDTRVGVVDAVCERLRWNGKIFSLTPYPRKDTSVLRMSVIIGERTYEDAQ